MATDSDNKKKISRWLRPLIFPFDESEPKAETLVLKHVGVNGKFADVRAGAVGPNPDEDRFQKILSGFEESIVDDCEGSGGVQKYVIQALNKDSHIIGRMTVRCTATRTEEENTYDSETEPPNAQGLTVALMRHVEATNRVSIGGWGNIITTQRQQIESLTEQNAVLVQRHLDMLENIEALSAAKHEREMDMIKEQNSAEIKQRIGRTFTALLPAVVKKMTGADIGPVTDPDTLSMREFLQTISEEELEKISSIIGPEKSMALLSMLQGEAAKTDN